MISSFQNSKQHTLKGRCKSMKGYTTDSGYMGYVNGIYILFASEEDYRDYIAG